MRCRARAAHNSEMAEDGNGPRPVPSLLPVTAVTDEDRNRYGLLLDRAAERGLISPYDYEARLRDLAEATSIEQMNRIVTELPAFTPTPATPARSAARRGRRPSTLSGAGVPTTSRDRSSPWLLLVIVVAVMIVSLVVLVIFADHAVRTHNGGLPPPMTTARALSALRL